MQVFDSDNAEADFREHTAHTISDMAIWRSIVCNIISADATLDDKFLLLKDAVPDKGIILSQLTLCKSLGLISNDHYSLLINSCLLDLNKPKNRRHVNPFDFSHDGA